MGHRIVIALLLVVLSGCSASVAVPAEEAQEASPECIDLPVERRSGPVSLEEALNCRRSVRDYAGEPLMLEEVGQLLWAAQGVTADWGGRTAPSAGGLYPLTVYLVAGDVAELESGVYRYVPDGHSLIPVRAGDVRAELSAAALRQTSVRTGAAVLAFCAVYERTTAKYGDRGVRYVHLEAGHAAQNVYLQAAAMGLGVVAVGAFDDAEVRKVLDLDRDEEVLYLMPVGKLA